MNFKYIGAIITVLSLNLLVLSSPVQDNEITTDDVDVVDVSTNGVESQNTINDIYLMDKAEVTDFSSDEEEEIIPDNFDEEVSKIVSYDEDENVIFKFNLLFLFWIFLLFIIIIIIIIIIILKYKHINI